MLLTSTRFRGMTHHMPSLTKKIIKGHAYYYLRECQRVNGKPKIVRTIYLGSAKTLLDRVTRPTPQQVDIHEFGASAATYDIACALDVVGTIDRHVPKRGTQGPTVGQYLLLAALNRCVAPRSKAQLGAWYAKTSLHRWLGISPSQLSSQRFWDNMDRVNEGHLRAIESDLSKTAVKHFGLDLRCLLYDATNFFTFIDSFNEGCTLAQRGHSKEGRANLRILGLALLVTSDGDVPLFHRFYPGNQTDAVTFRGVVSELADRCRELGRGACDITLVFDKGNNAEDNLQTVGQGPWHFVGSLVPSHHKDLLAIPREKMRPLDPIQFPSVRSYRTKKVVFGVERTVLSTFNQELFDAQCATLQRETNKRMPKLRDIQESLLRYAAKPRGKPPTVQGVQKKVDTLLQGKPLKDLFTTSVETSPTGLPQFSFDFNEHAWKHLQDTLLGKTILFTDRDDWTDEQIVAAYRSQSHVEAAFRRMKDPFFLTFRPTFHWTDQKLRVHAFCCVLALLIASLLRRRLAQNGLQHSLREMMAILSDIREVAIVYEKDSQSQQPLVRTMLSKSTPAQEKMLEVLDLQRYRVEA